MGTRFFAIVLARRGCRSCALLMLCALLLAGPRSAEASTKGNYRAVTALVYESLREFVPPPFLQFADSAYEIINRNVIQPTQEIDFTETSAESLWQRFNEWFERVAGIPFSQALGAAGNIFLWFLDLLTKPFRWLASLL
ncbi:MAG: hypothetical protein HY435_00235 [Candidatus Liptonbacteria bacterium]|nr:hypothetical protein [Candidatus Liptonbacteria bacterium]